MNITYHILKRDLNFGSLSSRSFLELSAHKHGLCSGIIHSLHWVLT